MDERKELIDKTTKLLEKADTPKLNLILRFVRKLI